MTLAYVTYAPTRSGLLWVAVRKFDGGLWFTELQPTNHHAGYVRLT